MRYFTLTIFLNVFFLNLHADKQIISNYLENLNKAAPFEKSEIYKKLSLAYYQDQDLEKAFKTFLIALDLSVPDDKAVFYESAENQEALRMYLEPKGQLRGNVAKQIIERFSFSYHQNQEDHLLGLILALAHANLNQFGDFFTLFYRSYILTPDHFLKYKTKAILNVKLFDRARTVQEKDKYREEIGFNLKKALELSPCDVNLNQLTELFLRKNKTDFLAEKPKEKNGN